MSDDIIIPRVYLRRPVDAKWPISSHMGLRVINGKQERHNGIDFACPEGTEVYAACDGSVFRAGLQNPQDPKEGYGLRVWQQAQIGESMFYLWYGHLSQILVQDHDMIKAGELIGVSGNTGRSTGPHLHLGIRKKDTDVYYDANFAIPT
jgi:murein DD-endopeptidase MepM/ murein hydrolase activator NlpD